MNLLKKELLVSFVFEHRHGLVHILGSFALLIMWIDHSAREFGMNDGYITLVCALSGIVLILTGVIIRLWSGLYIGGHKNSSLIIEGPYSLIRNPLYTGNLISALGVMLMAQSIYATIVVMFGLIMIYITTIKHEETKLLKIFHTDYSHYQATTSRFIPRRQALRDFLYEANNGDLITYRNLPRELKRGGLFLVTGLLVLFVAGIMH